MIVDSSIARSGYSPIGFGPDLIKNDQAYTAGDCTSVISSSSSADDLGYLYCEFTISNLGVRYPQAPEKTEVGGGGV